MAVDDLLANLRSVELFQGLSPLQITEIARKAERLVFRPGQTLIEVGHTGDAALLVISGDAVRTVAPAPGHLPEPIEPGSLVAEMAMLVESEHTSTIIARGPVKALRISRQALIAQMTDDPTLAEHFVDKITGRLKQFCLRVKAIEQSLAEPVASEAVLQSPERLAVA